jgi:hypothetical protein
VTAPEPRSGEDTFGLVEDLSLRLPTLAVSGLAMICPTNASTASLVEQAEPWLPHWSSTPAPPSLE